MKITRGYKTELDPTVKQHILLCQCAGASRFSYNYGLARKQCHGCGWKWEDMELSDRLFLCQNPVCRLFQVPQDRDLNASENLAELADEYLRSLR